MDIKKNLFTQCEASINNRLKTIEFTISSVQKALETETKSSAGDKHEIGRDMLQLEMEKASQQLTAVVKMKAVLAKIDIEKSSKIVCLGSIIHTNRMCYFLAVSCGKLEVFNKEYFAVSVSSPIGKLLLGKKEGDCFLFNNEKIEIIKVY